jgi:hypothetical protein
VRLEQVMAEGGLARWARAAESDFAAEKAEAEMRAHPRFAEAMNRAVAASLALFDSDPIMRRAMKNMSIQASIFFALYLDASGGLTLARIQQLCAHLGMMSPGRAVAMLAQLRLLRYVEPAVEQPDRRKKLYVPTSQMREAVLRHFHKDLLALALIVPDAQAVADGLGDPAIARKFIERFGESLIAVVRNYEEQSAAADIFLERQAGLNVLNALLLSGASDDVFPPAGPIRFSIAALARRFGVSRPHVRKLLRDAERKGLLRRDGEEALATLEPTLREAVMHYYASAFVGTAICAHATTSAARFAHRIDFSQGRPADI